MRLLVPLSAAAAMSAIAACAEMNGGPASSAMASGAPAAATEPAAPTTAAAYVTEAGRGDLFEIQSSQLALGRGASARVKDFANAMIRDHNESTQMVVAAASQAGMPTPPPPELDERRQAMIEQLKAASGAEFDRIYLRQQMTAHQEALKLHQGYAEGGDTAALRTAASQIAPVVQQHLTMLQGMSAP